MGPPSHMWFIVDRNVIIRGIPVLAEITKAIEDLCLHPLTCHTLLKTPLMGVYLH
jgi:hypothetical protein